MTPQNGLINDQNSLLMLPDTGHRPVAIISTFQDFVDGSLFRLNYLSTELAKHTFVVALSVSGETIENIDYIYHLNLSESSIIAITSSKTSTLGRLADIAISYNMLSEKINDTDITTQLPAIYILEKLAKSVRHLMVAEGEQD